MRGRKFQRPTSNVQRSRFNGNRGAKAVPRFATCRAVMCVKADQLAAVLSRREAAPISPVVAGVPPANSLCSRHGCLYRFISTWKFLQSEN
jgi:hypothetical protein